MAFHQLTVVQQLYANQVSTTLYPILILTINKPYFMENKTK